MSIESKTNNISFYKPKPKCQHLNLGILCKSLAISGLIILFLYYALVFNNHHCHTYLYNFKPFELKWPSSFSLPDQTIINNTTATNATHIVFVVAGSLTTWKFRKPYIEAWWRPNTTKGNLFLDKPPTEEFLPWPSTSPPFQVNEDITKLRIYPKLASPVQVRMFRSILDAFKLQADQANVDEEVIRWYVMADDDTLFFVDNLVETLGKYDHTKYYYIGMNSENVQSNFYVSFDMAFGGAGYALSYSLVKVLVTKLDSCIERYAYLGYSDYLSSSCLADLGVDLTRQMGIHQIDLRGDISGLLSAHPQTPLISLHHFDTIDPIFPSMNRSESINHLMKAAKVDQSRLLQQSICYQKQANWSISVSWGYSANIYENILPRSVLKRPIETFRPWSKPLFYMFNIRQSRNDSCESPHVFFFDSIKENTEVNKVVTVYTRKSPRNLPACSLTGNHSADDIKRIQVFSPRKKKEAGRPECCDLEYMMSSNVLDVKLRACGKDEIIA